MSDKWNFLKTHTNRIEEVLYKFMITISATPTPQNYPKQYMFDHVVLFSVCKV